MAKRKKKMQDLGETNPQLTPLEMGQELLDSMKEKIKSYFIAHTDRMTRDGAVAKFADKRDDQMLVDFAFDSLIKEGFMQSTGVVDGDEVFGHSANGSVLPQLGWWVRTPLKIKKEGAVRIPVQMFKGFLETQTKRRAMINDMEHFAIYDRYLLCNNAAKAMQFIGLHYTDDADWEKQESFDSASKEAENGRKLAMQIRTHSYFYTYMGTGKGKLLWDIYKDGNFSNEKATLYLMYLALGSIQGSRSFAKTNNNFLLSRMDGNDSLVPPEQWSQEIQAIATRRKLDRFKRLMTEYYGVVFVSPKGCHGYYFSTKLKEEDFFKAVINSMAAPDGKQRVQKRKEPTARQKFEEMQRQMSADSAAKWQDF